MKRFALIGFIWLGCAVAWLVLGTTIDLRTGGSSGALLGEVHALWGAPIEQQPPTAGWSETVKRTESVTQYYANGVPYQANVEKEVDVHHPLTLSASDITAALDLEQRRKGLLWFPTYAVDFSGRYTFTNPEQVAREVTVTFPITNESAGIDGFLVRDAGGEVVPYQIDGRGARWTARFGPGADRTFAVAFKTRGTSSWTYRLVNGADQVRDFHLKLRTTAEEIDFPAGTLSPTKHRTADGGWEGEWSFTTLISSAPIGVELPKVLNPGEVASRITFFAPVGLLFFFFVVSILAVAQRKNIHPANYFFFGTAFFAFHLLFAYLVDHVPLFPSFFIASLVSLALIVSYARLFTGWTFALREMAIAQTLYLVLFSFSFFWNGFTGLAITIGAIVTLFAMMQVTGRLDFSRLQAPSSPPPTPPTLHPHRGEPIVNALPTVAEAFSPGTQPEARG